MATNELDSGRPAGRRRIVLRFVLGTVILAFGGLAVCLYVLVRDARDAALACRSQCRLNQLHWALHNYHHAHGCFPPAYVADENGQPMHSWRVLILPFMSEEERELHDAYRFDEPWDGPNNRQLADRMPAIFHIDSEPPSTRMTNVVVIVGPATAFPGSTSSRMEDFGVLPASVYESSAGICYRWLPGEISWRMIDEQDQGRRVGEAGEGSASVRPVASHASSPIAAARIAVGRGGRVGA